MEDINKRLEICKHCAIYQEATSQCSAQLYIDPKTNTAYTEAQENTIKGCGCYIPTKVKNIYNHCPAHKW